MWDSMIKSNNFKSCFSKVGASTLDHVWFSCFVLFSSVWRFWYHLIFILRAFWAVEVIFSTALHLSLEKSPSMIIIKDAEVFGLSKTDVLSWSWVALFLRNSHMMHCTINFWNIFLIVCCCFFKNHFCMNWPDVIFS